MTDLAEACRDLAAWLPAAAALLAEPDADGTTIVAPSGPNAGNSGFEAKVRARAVSKAAVAVSKDKAVGKRVREAFKAFEKDAPADLVEGVMRFYATVSGAPTGKKPEALRRVGWLDLMLRPFGVVSLVWDCCCRWFCDSCLAAHICRDWRKKPATKGKP